MFQSLSCHSINIQNYLISASCVILPDTDLFSPSCSVFHVKPLNVSAVLFHYSQFFLIMWQQFPFYSLIINCSSIILFFTLQILCLKFVHCILIMSYMTFNTSHLSDISQHLNQFDFVNVIVLVMQYLSLSFIYFNYLFTK